MTVQIQGPWNGQPSHLGNVVCEGPWALGGGESGDAGVRSVSPGKPRFSEARLITYLPWLMKTGAGFPGGAVVRNPPANAGDMGSSHGPGRSHVPWSNWACLPQLLSLCSRARKAQLLSPCATTTEARTPRARAPQQEKPSQGEACPSQRRVAPTRRNQRKPARSNRPNRAKNK